VDFSGLQEFGMICIVSGVLISLASEVIYTNVKSKWVKKHWLLAVMNLLTSGITILYYNDSFVTIQNKVGGFFIIYIFSYFFY